MNRLSLITPCSFLIIGLIGGCGEDGEATVKQTSAAPPAAPREVGDEPVAQRPDGGDVETRDRGAHDPENRPIAVRTPPKRPEDTWVIFREAFDAEEDATCETDWLGHNRFRIKTRNIQRMTVDLTELPRGAPKTGPWVLLIDGQGVEMTGFKPKEGYTGLKRDLVRSRNGRWTVDRRRLYHPGE